MAANSQLDIGANRRAAKYSAGTLVARVLWALARPLFRFSPRPCFGWRRLLLRAFGARVGANVHVYNTAVIYMPWNLAIGDWSSVGEYAFVYNLGLITLGRRVTISHRAHLCAGTHDYTQADMPLLKPPIIVGDDAWVCADAFVGAGVCVGEGSVIGARAVAVKDVDPWTVVAGNPANFLKKRTIDDPRPHPDDKLLLDDYPMPEGRSFGPHPDGNAAIKSSTTQ